MNKICIWKIGSNLQIMLGNLFKSSWIFLLLLKFYSANYTLLFFQTIKFYFSECFFNYTWFWYHNSSTRNYWLINYLGNVWNILLQETHLIYLNGCHSKADSKQRYMKDIKWWLICWPDVALVLIIPFI